MLCDFGYSQINDSIKNILGSKKSNLEQIKSLNKLCEDCWLTGNYKDSKTLVDKLFQLEQKGLIKSPEDKELLKEQAYTFNNLAIIYRYQGNYSASIENHLKALKIREKINDIRGIARSNLGLGSINDFLGKKELALNYKFKAKKLFEEAKDTIFTAIACHHIAGLYFDLGKIDEAEKYNGMALMVFIKKFKLSGMADAYTLAGQIYESRKEYADAINNYKGSLSSKTFLGLRDGIIDANFRLGVVYFKMKDITKAKKHLNTGLVLAKQIGSKSSISDIYKHLAMVDSLSNNYASAFSNYKLYIAYKDSLVNQASAEKISQLQSDFENDKIEQIKKREEEQKEALRKDREYQQKVILYSISGGLILVLVFFLFLFRSYQQKQKINNELIVKNDIIEKQKHIVEEKQTEILDSINYAKRIQYALLASDKLLNENLTNYFLFFKPKDVVSGDFYWGTILSNGNFLLATADSTGHGVPGAIMSMLNISCLNEAINSDKKIEPANILNATRSKVISHLANDGSADGGKDGMDCSICVFDFKNLKLQIAAANNPVWIVRSSETEALEATGDTFKTYNSKFSIFEIKPDKMPVGKHDKQDTPFTLHEINLQKGDMVYTLTDGFPDQFGGEKGKKYMIKNLRELIVSNAHLPMHEQKQLLETTFNNWKGTNEQVDDVTVVGIRV